MNRIRIFTIDDHALFLSGLRSLLRERAGNEIEVIGQAVSGKEALSKLATLRPDVILLDLTLPDGSGIHWLGEILAHWPDAKIIVLTMHDDAALARASLAKGARGFVVKTAADTELVSAITAVAKGRSFVNLDLSAERMGDLLTKRNETPSDEPTDPLRLLSNREREVFVLLALGHTNQEIADRFDLSVKTVETYRARIVEKYGFRSRAEMTRFALDAGLLAAGSSDNAI